MPNRTRRRIGIVGAGIAGLSAARALAGRGHDVTLIDKGRGPGGRTSSRRSSPGAFDHGAQYFTARDPRFCKALRAWCQDGLVAQWPRALATIAPGEPTTVSAFADGYVAVPRMSALAKHLASGLTVHVSTEIARIRRSGAGWIPVSTNGQEVGGFDALLVTVPAPQARQLLHASDLAEPPQLADVVMLPCWAAMLSLPALNLPFDAAHVHDDDIAWIAYDSGKPGRRVAHDESRLVVHATTSFSATRIDDPPESIAAAMTARTASLLPELPAPRNTVVHLWRFARVAQTAQGTENDGVVAAGEGLWLAGDGYCNASRVEDAWLSGVAAARNIANN